MEKDMEKKYYTPSIEEFHVGFEIEWLDKTEWRKVHFMCLEQFGFSDVEDLVKQTRVKYLDREDIESLGFYHTGKETWTDIYNINSNPKYATWVMKVINIPEMKKDGKYVSDKEITLLVSIKFFHPDDAKGELHFYGEIKNKSELKNVLKMIGI